MSQSGFQLIYILPNLFTAASIFTAVLSIASAINGNIEKSAWLIFLSLVFDTIDGKVARLTHTTSRFGIEFDSIADSIAFGVAPGVLLYQFIAFDYGKFGVTVVALYVIFGSIRLARFNIMSPNTDPSVFIGLPIPAAAMFLSAWVLMFDKYEPIQSYSFFLLLSALIVSLLMVSNIRYPSFKSIGLKKPAVIKILVVFIILLSSIYMYPVEGLASLITVYLLWGVFRGLKTVINFRRSS